MGNTFKEFCNFDNDDDRIEILVKFIRMKTEEPAKKDTLLVNLITCLLK
jgi:hypothetical protein